MGLFSSLFGSEKNEKKQKKTATSSSENGRERTIAAMQAQAGDLVTADRAELIRNAMAVQRAKQTILSDLSSEDRARSVASAITGLLHDESQTSKK